MRLPLRHRFVVSLCLLLGGSLEKERRLEGWVERIERLLWRWFPLLVLLWLLLSVRIEK